MYLLILGTWQDHDAMCLKFLKLKGAKHMLPSLLCLANTSMCTFLLWFSYFFFTFFSVLDYERDGITGIFV